MYTTFTTQMTGGENIDRRSTAHILGAKAGMSLQTSFHGERHG